MRFRFLVIVVLSFVFFWSPASYAQVRDTGAISVRVIDPDGAVLPGVLVSVDGPLGVRTEYTGINGSPRWCARTCAYRWAAPSRW
jgi:hypothetical protein